MKWQRARFAELFRVKHGFAFKSEYFDTAGPYALLTPGNFHETGGFRERGEKQPYFTGEVPAGYILEEGDLVVAMTEQEHGLLGSSVWVPESNRYLHNQRLGRIVDLDATRLHKRFLYYLFNTRGVRSQISGSASGTKVRHTAPERLGRVEVKLPTLNEQRRIAEVMTAYDESIENNRRRMALLEGAAHQLYAGWFVRLRYPGYASTRGADILPKGWKRRALAEVADVNIETLGRAFQGELEYVDISAVTPGRIGETTRYDFADAPSRARRVVRHGDIIWSCVRPNRRSHAVIWNPAPNLIVSTGFAVLTPKTLPTTYLYQAATTDAFTRNLENRARGAAYPAVVARDFEESEIIVPPAQLVNAFNDIAEPLLAQIETLNIQNQKLRAARDLLLPRLMAGEIAV